MSQRIEQFWCPECAGTMQLIIVGEFARPDEGEPTTFYYFGRCVRCGRPGLVSDEETGPQQWDRTPTVQLYPPLQGITAALPPKVDESYREAMKCAAARAWLATAVMVRRTLEAIAREFDPNAKSLFKGLHAMKEKGLISEELSQWGDALRFIGNIGAHPTDDKVTEQDARDAVEFLEAIVETIYDLRPKFQRMASRRTNGPGEESPAE